MQLIQEIQAIAAQKEPVIQALSQQIWQYAELTWQEQRSCQATIQALEAEAFSIARWKACD